MKGKTNLIPLAQLWKRNTIPILCLHRYKPCLISRGSLPLTNFQLLRKLLQSFWCYWLLYTRTWNCWYFDTHGKEAPSTFQFFVLYCFRFVLKIALDSSSQELTGSRAETAGVETHTELVLVKLWAYSSHTRMFFLISCFENSSWELKSRLGAITFVELCTFANVSKQLLE